MKKIYIAIFLLLTAMFFFVGNLYFGEQKIEKESIVHESLIKNLNWDSPLKSEIPYVIGNQVELYYVLNATLGSNFVIDLRNLKKEFNISSISIGDVSLDITDTISFTIYKNTPLVIRGVANNNSSYSEKTLLDLIEVTVLPIASTDIEKRDDSQEDNILSENVGEDIEEDIPSIDEASQVQFDSDSIKLSKTVFHSSVDNLLEIRSDIVDDIAFLNIGSYSYIPNIRDGVAYFLIEKNTHDTGRYFAFIQTRSGTVIPLKEEITFQYNDSPVSIVNITPSTVDNAKASYIVLQGTGFSDIISIQLSNNVVLKSTSFDIINDNVLSVKIAPDLEPGKYNFNIMTVDNIINIDTMHFTIKK